MSPNTHLLDGRQQIGYREKIDLINKKSPKNLALIFGKNQKNSPLKADRF